jgi:hypothetical protein
MYGARSAKRTVSLTTVPSRTRLKSWKPVAAAEDAAGRRGELRLRPLLLWRVALRGPQESWKLVVAAENLTNTAFCTGVLNQPNTAAFGLNKPGDRRDGPAVCVERPPLGCARSPGEVLISGGN